MADTSTRTGNYPIERRIGEVGRLHLQSAALAPETATLLDRIGVGPGWRCLDLGCGPRGISHDLSARVGPDGHVLGLEYDPDFVSHARETAPANVEFVAGDAYATGLPDDSFDLVHIRFLACTAGDPVRLIAEARRLARPGGIVALQEANAVTLNCYPPHPAWDALRAAWIGSFPDPGAEPVAQQLYRILRRAGFADVQYRPVVVGVRADDPWRDYLPATIESLRNRVLDLGLIAPEAFDSMLAACRSHLAHPDTVFTSFMTVQVWGRRTAA